jgi:hypothetical protein
MKSAVFGLTTLMTLVFATRLAAQSAQVNREAFSWSAELVALDENARMITVKAPTVGEQASPDFAHLKTGERIMLKWSGYDLSADSISRALRPVEVKSDERFVFPVEFVSFDKDRRYVTFKVQVPENSIANMKALKPGEWVTATSPHGAPSKTTPIASIRPYVITATTTSSNNPTGSK